MVIVDIREQHINPNYLPVVAHNFSGYDSHLFIQKFCKKIEGKLTLITYSKEKYKSFTKQIHLESLNDDEDNNDSDSHKNFYLR